MGAKKTPGSSTARTYTRKRKKNNF